MRRRSRTAPSAEVIAGTRNLIAMRTSQYTEGGLRVDFDLLDEGEQVELVRLAAEANEDGWNPARLGKRARRLEALIEKGAQAPDVFENARAAEEIRALTAEAHRAAVRRPIRRGDEERGLLAEIAEHLARGWLDADHSGLLLLVLAAIQTGHGFAPRSRVEATVDGAVYVIDAGYGLAGDRDPEGRLAGWRALLDHLEVNQWLAVSKLGPQWSIGLGSRTVRALQQGKTKAKAA